MTLSTVSVIVLNWNGGSTTERCLGSALAQTRAPDELIVVDNASTDGSAERLAAEFGLTETVPSPESRVPSPESGAGTRGRRDAGMTKPRPDSGLRTQDSGLAPRRFLVRNPRNLGFGGGMNVGLARARGDLVVLLNQDVVLDRNCLAAIAGAFERASRATIVGVKVLEADGKTIQHAGGFLRLPWALADHYGHGEVDEGQCDTPREVDYVTGAVLGLRRAPILALGGFDEGFFPAYFEDADLCHRAAMAGQLVWYEPRAVALHGEATSTGKDSERYFRYYHHGRVRYVLKHFPPAWIVREFLPAELHRLEHAMVAAERAGVAAAYRDNLLAWPLDEHRRHSGLGTRDLGLGTPEEAVADALTTLRAEAYTRGRTIQTGDDRSTTAAHGGRPGAKGRRRIEHQAGMTKPDAQLPGDDLAERARLVEHVFTSRVPVVGHLIARARELWNSASTKWYVRPLAQQQSDFNARVAARFAELDQRLVALDRELAELTRELGRQGLRQRQLERRLPQLEASGQPPAFSHQSSVVSHQPSASGAQPSASGMPDEEEAEARRREDTKGAL